MRKSIHREIATRPDIVKFLVGNGDMRNLFELPSSIERSRVDLYKKLYEDIGNTPIVTIRLKNNNKLYVKQEYLNAQGNNHYSRYWIPYLWIAETLGILAPDIDEIIEVSSGSSGIALSNACQKLGFKLSMIIPKGLPKARVEPMKNSNTTILEVDGYIDACVQKLRKMILEDRYRYFVANHAEEQANVIIHIFSRIAYEYLAIQHSPPDYAILAVGNGTSAEAISSVFHSALINKGGHRSWIIGFHPNFNLGKANPVLGLLPENVKFKHVEILKEQRLIDSIEFTNEYGISDVKKQYHYDEAVANFGESSLYALGIANKLATRMSNQVFFSVAYDHINRYN